MEKPTILERKIMNKKIAFLVICLCFTCLLSGCSPFPKKPKASDAISYSRMCINSGVEASGERNHSERNSYGKKYYYPMIDERGIEFNVIATNSKDMFFDAYTPFYSNFLAYTTDYKSCVINYYMDDIENILKTVSVDEFDVRANILDITLTEDNSLEEIAAMIMEIDNLLDFDYRNNAVLQDLLGAKCYWSCTDSYDLLIKMRDSENESIISECFLFSDNNRTNLSYDMVLKTLELGRMVKESDNTLFIVQVNGELYYDLGEITQDEMTGKADGTTTSRINHVPKVDGQTNFGAGVDYQFAPDGTLYVYLSDGRHVFVKY